MFDIKSMDQNLISLNKFQTYNSMGEPVMEVQVGPGFDLVDMKQRLDSLSATIEVMQLERDTERELIAKNPAVKDAYEKYKLVEALARMEAEESNGAS